VETAGKSLEQIDRWFASNPGWRVDKSSKEEVLTERRVESLREAEDQERMLKEFDIGSDEDI
jgi:hypothetical protein